MPEPLNHTEMTALVRAAGMRIPAFLPMEQLVELFKTVEAGKTSPKPKPPLLDRHRSQVIKWGMEQWPRIHGQITCPLEDAGCFGCTDFRMTACLVRNSHIFNTGKEVEMATWHQILQHIIDREPKRAATLFEEAMPGDVADDRPTRTVLMKMSCAVLDMAAGETKDSGHYLSARNVSTPEVKEFMRDKTATEVRDAIIEKLKSISVKPEPETAKEERPVEEKVVPKGNGDGEKAPVPEEEEEAYFPGVEVTGPPLAARDAFSYSTDEGPASSGKTAPEPARAAPEPTRGAAAPQESAPAPPRRPFPMEHPAHAAHHIQFLADMARAHEIMMTAYREFAANRLSVIRESSGMTPEPPNTQTSPTPAADATDQDESYDDVYIPEGGDDDIPF